MAKYTEVFEMFWRQYPFRIHDNGKKVKIGKWEAFEQWRRLNEDDRNSALMAIIKMQDDKYIPDACRWLRRRRWEDECIDADEVWDDSMPNCPCGKKSTKYKIVNDKLVYRCDKCSF